MSSAELQQPTNHRPTDDDLDLLAKVSEMLTSLDREHLLERVIELSAKGLGAERASLILNPDYHADWASLYTRNPSNFSMTQRLFNAKEPVTDARQVIEKGLAGWVMRHKRGAVITDTEKDDRWYTFGESSFKARSAICVPFMQNDKVLAAVTLAHSQPNHFTDHHLRLLTIIANQSTVAIRNAQLFNRILAQRRQLEAVLRSIPDILMVLDANGCILIVNDEAVRFLSESGNMNELIGRTLKSFAHVDSALTQIAEITSSPAKIGANWSFEARSEQQRKDFLASVSVWTSISAAGSSSLSGSTTNAAATSDSDHAGYVIIMRDITTMRDLARFKDEMLRLASHDLRGPLGLIVGYTSLIEMDTAEMPAVQEYLHIIEKSTTKMHTLLDDLLRVEQIRTSPLELNQQVDYRDLINTVLNNVRPMIDSKNQDLKADLRIDNLQGVSVNPVLIREAMENLITNAIKYTPEKGMITVRSYRQMERVYFVVEDTGVGIPKDMLPRLFQSFFRARQPGTEKVDGRGLGLSLVKTIIERHRGEVWVESEEGKGSVFGFWIPVFQVE